MKASLLMSPDLNYVQSKLLYLMLLRYGKYSFLPDLYDAIGEDNDMMIRLLSLFAGQKISFPTPDLIASYTKDIVIYYRLIGLAGHSFTSAVEELSADYGVETEEIRRLFRKMRDIAHDAGFKITRR